MNAAAAWLMLAVWLGAAPSAAAAQTRSDTAVAAGPQYRAGALHRLFFGTDYRELWATPVRVPQVDMARWGGGLTPTTAGGGMQTKSLRFRGGDGRQYGFRSVDKDAGIVPDELRGTFVEDLVQDQTSSALPAGPAVATVLMEAAGVLHTTPRLVVLPDDAALGQFRERFAGTLGFIEARAVTGPDVPAFAGAAEIISGTELIDRADRGPGDRIDTRAFLRARLIDLFIGDWDRHRDQFRWARFGPVPPGRWVPIPEDRDQAFVRYDGLMLSIARNTAPELVEFGPRYSSIFGWSWNGREFDRRFLMELDRAGWDSVVVDFRSRMTDSVIDLAVRALPPEHFALRGAWMANTLRARRERLAAVAAEYYRLLARWIDVQGTAMSDAVLVERLADGAVDVRLAAGGAEYFRRRVDPGETDEIRVYLGAGPDRAVVRGAGPGRITVRIVGSGDDVLADSSAGGGTSFHLEAGDVASGPGRAHVDRRRYRPPPKRRPTEQPPRDWGSRWRAVGVVAAAPDLGFVLGAGFLRTGYGFRKLPEGSRLRVRAGFASAARTGRADVVGLWRRPSSRVRYELEVLVSGLEVIRYHDLGNEIAAPEGDEFYRVNQATVAVSPSLVLALGPAELALGPTARYADTRDTPGRLVAIRQPYGARTFGQAGVRAELRFDGRDVPERPTRGAQFTLGGAWYPAMWDVDSAFGEIHGEAAAYASAPRAPLQPTLALRAGVKQVRGHYPFHEAAFIGDARSVRLGRQNRYGGDAAAWANAELRMRLGAFFILLPGDFGFLALGDVGRVFLDGETSSRWHGAAGGGLWFSAVRPGNVFSVALARSSERTGVYFRAGFAY